METTLMPISEPLGNGKLRPGKDIKAQFTISRPAAGPMLLPGPLAVSNRGDTRWLQPGKRTRTGQATLCLPFRPPIKRFQRKLMNEVHQVTFAMQAGPGRRF